MNEVSIMVEREKEYGEWASCEGESEEGKKEKEKCEIKVILTK